MRWRGQGLLFHLILPGNNPGGIPSMPLREVRAGTTVHESLLLAFSLASLSSASLPRGYIIYCHYYHFSETFINCVLIIPIPPSPPPPPRWLPFHTHQTLYLYVLLNPSSSLSAVSLRLGERSFPEMADLPGLTPLKKTTSLAPVVINSSSAKGETSCSPFQENPWLSSSSQAGLWTFLETLQ